MGMQTTREAWLEKLATAWTAWVYGDTGQVVTPDDAPSAIQYLAGELAADPEVCIVPVRRTAIHVTGQVAPVAFAYDDGSVEWVNADGSPVGELEGDSPTGSVITSTPEEQ